MRLRWTGGPTGRFRGDPMNGVETRAAYIRRRVMTLYNEHRADKMIPTSNRFLVYELVQLSVIDKKPTGILKPGAKMQRRTDQEVIDALTWLREHEHIPWSAIVDETRSYDNFTGWRSIAEGLVGSLPFIRLDPWNGKPPPLILTESRSLAGVLRVQVEKYCAIITSTNGQSAGFLRTEIAPLLRDRQNVLYLGDLDKGGGDIEANTRRVLERERPDCTLLVGAAGADAEAGPSGIACRASSRPTGGSRRTRPPEPMRRGRPRGCRRRSLSGLSPTASTSCCRSRSRTFSNAKRSSAKSCSDCCEGRHKLVLKWAHDDRRTSQTRTHTRRRSDLPRVHLTGCC